MLYVNLKMSSCYILYHSVPDESACSAMSCMHMSLVCNCYEQIKYYKFYVHACIRTCNNSNSCSTLVHTQVHRAQGPVP